MLIVTTNSVEDHPVQQNLGVGSGEAVNGGNMFKDIAAGFRNMVGGRSASYEQELQQAHTDALNEMAQRAQAMGANAVIGARVDYFTTGSDGSMLVAVANGTAVAIS